MFTRSWWRIPASILLLVSAAGAQDEVEFEGNPIPDLFAALMTVTLSKDIATASFHVDNGT